MAKHNQNNKPQGPTMSTTLTEVNPDKGLTPEQMAVCQSLPAYLGKGKLAEQAKERHPERLKASELSSPVATVKAMFTAMHAADPAMTRKDMINKAIAAGIAFYTARTQYQVWKSGGKKTETVDSKPALDLAAFTASLAKTA